MAARTLRHYAKDITAANTWESVHSAVPAARALVARVVIANVSGTTVSSIHCTIGAGAGSPRYIIAGLTLSAGESFEQHVVMLAGEYASIYCNTIGGINAAVFGEEVDN